LHNFHDTELFSAHGVIVLIIELAPSTEDEDDDDRLLLCRADGKLGTPLHCILQCRELHLHHDELEDVSPFRFSHHLLTRCDCICSEEQVWP